MSAARLASAAELLDALDQGEGLSPAERALLLAHAADRGADPGGLPLGARDRSILRLRSELLGPTIEAQDTCPHCHGAATFEIDCARLDLDAPADNGGVIVVRLGEYEAVCHRPTGSALVEAARTTDVSRARDLLLAATVVRVGRGGRAVAVSSLPADLVEEIGRRVAEADPLAEVSLTVVCAACDGSWDTVLDVADFVWRELREWGRRLLGEVHVLAAAYGWPERDILTLAPRRRQAYLRLVLGA